MADSLIEYISCSNGLQFVEELQKYGQVMPLKEIYDEHSPEQHHIVVGTVKYVDKFVSDENAKLIKLILREHCMRRQGKKFFYGFVFNEFATELKNVNLKPGDHIAFRSGYVENNTMLNIPPYIHDLQIVLGFHRKNGAKIFLMKAAEHANIEKSSAGEKAGASNNEPQSTAENNPKKMYKYKKVSEICAIGLNFNLYGVIKGIIKVILAEIKIINKNGIIAN